MKRLLDQILIIDIEATCWESRHETAANQSEIIEIGVCLLDMSSLAAGPARSIFVRPEHSDISPFCTRLTTLTPELIAREGVSFADACAILVNEFQAPQRVWASFGDYDRTMFERQCQARDVACPLGRTHLNVRWLAAARLRLAKEPELPQALAARGLELQGTLHRGADDAGNIARLLAELIR